MAKLLVLLLITARLNAWGTELKTGDILLQPLACWSCTLIEQQENTIFSHIGIYIEVDGEDFVVEAYGNVRLTSLSKFLNKTEEGQSVLVKRFIGMNDNLANKIKATTLSKVGLPYDSAFLWDNTIRGQEAIYCSELVYKVYAAHMKFDYLKPKTMLFDINPKLWDRHFRDKTPRGKIGISPEDFNQSFEFRDLFEL